MRQLLPLNQFPLSLRNRSKAGGFKFFLNQFVRDFLEMRRVCVIGTIKFERKAWLCLFIPMEKIWKHNNRLGK
jgi:hypothetical protein